MAGDNLKTKIEEARTVIKDECVQLMAMCQEERDHLITSGDDLLTVVALRDRLESLTEDEIKAYVKMSISNALERWDKDNRKVIFYVLYAMIFSTME